MKKKSEELIKAQNEQISALGNRKEVEEDLGVVIEKIRELEVGRVRKSAMRTQEKRMIDVLEQEKQTLVEMINKQH